MAWFCQYIGELSVCDNDNDDADEEEEEVYLGFCAVAAAAGSSAVDAGAPCRRSVVWPDAGSWGWCHTTYSAPYDESVSTAVQRPDGAPSQQQQQPAEPAAETIVSRSVAK